MKVSPFHILKPVDENLIVQVDRSKGFYRHLHQHAEIQLSLIAEGQGKLLIGDSIHRFGNGDFFAIGSHCPHLFQSDDEDSEIHMISLFFTERTLGEGFFELPDLMEARPFFEIIAEGFRPLAGQLEIAELMCQFPEISRLSRIISFLHLLRQCSQIETKALTHFKYHRRTGPLAGERLQVVFDYLLNHFHDEVKLDHVARLVHMTPNAFCKFFKKRTNKTLFQFIIELRIEHAGQLLKKHPDLSMAHVAERSGFQSISNFNRKFKALKGMSPSQFAGSETRFMA